MSLADPRREPSKDEPNSPLPSNDSAYLRAYLPDENPPARKKTTLLFGIAALVLVALISATLVFYVTYADYRVPPPPVVHPVVTVPANPNLELAISQQGHALVISWNQSDPRLKLPRGGLLLIEDRGIPRSLKLTAGQLSGGALMYQPHSTDVKFTLQIMAHDGVKVSGASHYTTPPAQK